MRVKSRSEIGTSCGFFIFYRLSWETDCYFRHMAKTTEGTVPGRRSVDVRECFSTQPSPVRATLACRHASVTAGSSDGSRGTSEGLFLVSLWVPPF